MNLKKTKKFSIITPAFKQLDWLRLCIASVADQEGLQLEIEHIIQDGGTPGITEFLQKQVPALGLTIIPTEGDEALRASKPGYTLILYTGPDAGMYEAINKGITRMKGELWAWLNCDEQYLPGTLEYVVEWFDHHCGMDILCGDALLTDEAGEALSYRRIIPPHWKHTRLVHA
jgi:GT2 family glycosyltransferase